MTKMVVADGDELQMYTATALARELSAKIGVPEACKTIATRYGVDETKLVHFVTDAISGCKSAQRAAEIAAAAVKRTEVQKTAAEFSEMLAAAMR